VPVLLLLLQSLLLLQLLTGRMMMGRTVAFAWMPRPSLARSPAVLLLLLLLSLLPFCLLHLLLLDYFQLFLVELKMMMRRSAPPRQEGCAQTF